MKRRFYVKLEASEYCNLSSTHHYPGSDNIGSWFFPPSCSCSITTALVSNLGDYNLSMLQYVVTQMPSSKSEKLLSVQVSSCWNSPCLQDQVHNPWPHESFFSPSPPAFSDLHVLPCNTFKTKQVHLFQKCPPCLT